MIDWSEIRKTHVIYSETEPKKRLSAYRIERMKEQDLDYLCMLKSAKGTVVRHNATHFNVYMPHGRRSEIRKKIEALGSMFIAGDREFVAICPEATLPTLTKLLQLRRRQSHVLTVANG